MQLALEAVCSSEFSCLAAADFRHDQHITVEEFEAMYRNLLKAQYEPEVLELDLDRAIKVLLALRIPFVDLLASLSDSRD